MTREAVQAVTTLADEVTRVVESLTPEEWAAPSGCIGWSVQDLVAHVSSNLLLLVHPPAPSDPPPPPMPAEQAQDALVQARAGWSAEQVRAELVDNRDGAVGVLAALQDEPLAGAPITLSELGTYRSHQLADAFAFDLYCHLRVDLLAPTGPVRRDLPPVSDELLAPGIGWMLAGLPQMCLPVADVLDRPLGLRLTGPGGGGWTLAPGDTRPVINTGVDADTVVTSSAVDFVRWGTKREDWRATSTVSGDDAYAASVLDALNIV